MEISMLKIIISVLCILTFEKINSMEFLNGLADFCNRLGQIGTMSQVPQYNQQQAWNSQYNTTPQFNQMYTQQAMYMQNQQNMSDVDWFGAPAMQFLYQNGFNDQMRINVVQQFFQFDSDYPANLAYQYDNTLKDQIMHFINSRQSIMNDTAVNCAGRRQRGSHYESVQYDDDDNAGSEESSEDSLDQYSWGDEDYVEEITDDANFNSLKGILSNATLLRYTLEMWKHENPNEYQMLLDAINVYNNTVAAGKMIVAANCIAATGPVGLVPIAASLAVFQGVELFAEAVSKYGADKLATSAAGRDSRKYESYFKTCKHFTDFIATLGVSKLANKQVKQTNTKPTSKKSKQFNEPEAKARNTSTLVDLDRYINNLMVECPKCLRYCGQTRDKYNYYEVMKKCEYRGIYFKKGDYISEDHLHFEIEWFRGKDYHMGAINVLTGVLKDKSRKPNRRLLIK